MYVLIVMPDGKVIVEDDAIAAEHVAGGLSEKFPDQKVYFIVFPKDADVKVRWCLSDEKGFSISY